MEVGRFFFRKTSDIHLLSQWLTFKLFGITYLVGKIKFKLLFHGPWLSKSRVQARYMDDEVFMSDIK